MDLLDELVAPAPEVTDSHPLNSPHPGAGENPSCGGCHRGATSRIVVGMGTTTRTPLAVIETQVVHDAHRRATQLLADAVADGGAPADAMAALRDLVVAMLRHHHEAEDEDLFPLLLQKAPELSASLAALSVEHDRVEELLDHLDGDPQSVAAPDVRRVVHEHLDHEEPILFPALRTHVTASEWDAFSARTVASTPPIGKHLLVALLHEVATDDEVQVVLRQLPPEARALVPTMRAEAAPTLTALRAGVGR
jgi:hypothetical protein